MNFKYGSAAGGYLLLSSDCNYYHFIDAADIHPTYDNGILGLTTCQLWPAMILVYRIWLTIHGLKSGPNGDCDPPLFVASWLQITKGWNLTICLKVSCYKSYPFRALMRTDCARYCSCRF